LQREKTKGGRPFIDMQLFADMSKDRQLCLSQAREEDAIQEQKEGWQRQTVMACCASSVQTQLGDANSLADLSD